MACNVGIGLFDVFEQNVIFLSPRYSNSTATVRVPRVKVPRVNSCPSSKMDQGWHQQVSRAPKLSILFPGGGWGMLSNKHFHVCNIWLTIYVAPCKSNVPVGVQGTRFRRGRSNIFYVKLASAYVALGGVSQPQRVEIELCSNSIYHLGNRILVSCAVSHAVSHLRVGHFGGEVQGASSLTNSEPWPVLGVLLRDRTQWEKGHPVVAIKQVVVVNWGGGKVKLSRFRLGPLAHQNVPV